jgi:hypothetical protein
MDQSFFLRAERMLVRDRTAGIDHGMLVAALEAHQAASRTARIAASERRQREPASAAEPLPELILGGQCWREAVSAQRGCFNRSIAGHGVNGS